MYFSKSNQQTYAHRLHFALLAGMLLVASLASRITEIQPMLSRMPANLAQPRVTSAESVAPPRLPLSFIPNVGQSAPDVQMEAQVSGGRLQFSATGVTMLATQGERIAPLFTVEFYADLLRLLADRGIVVTQADNPVFCPYALHSTETIFQPGLAVRWRRRLMARASGFGRRGAGAGCAAIPSRSAAAGP